MTGCHAHAAAPTEADYAQRRVSAPVASVDAPQTAEEAALDTLDFVNLRVFGNSTFRLQQREVIEAVLKVWSCSFPSGRLLATCGMLLHSH